MKYGMHTRREFLKAGLAAGSLAVSSSSVFGQSGDLSNLTLEEASRLVRKKSVSPVELTRVCLARIERLNPKLNAFITVTAEQAMAQARTLEQELQRGNWRGPLHGIPIALKDNIDTAGTRTTAASAVFADRVPTEHAEVVRRLKAAGAVIVGKLNMHEFAYGTTSAISHYGPVRNPWNLAHIAGGSSGGSASAVAAGLCYGAIGTETGASIRLPSACCGIVGLKPTYGLVSSRGLVPVSWSFDNVGPMCRTVADTAILLNAIAGYDPENGGSVDAAVPNYTAHLRAKTRSLRLGRQSSTFYEKIDPQVEVAVNKALAVLSRLTSSIREVKLPSPDSSWPTVDAEAYAYHAPLLAKTPQLYKAETRRDLLAASKVSMTDYIRARRDLDRLRQTVASVFNEVDLLVAPTIPRPALTVAECNEPFQMPSSTEEFSVYGLPSISILCGFTTSGLPIGLQISGPRLKEVNVLHLAYAYEQATDWHRRRPAL